MLPDGINLPKVTQKTHYSCGPAALLSVFKYFGVNTTEELLIDLLKTDSQNGTSPYRISRYAKKLGFNSRLKKNMSLDDVVEYLDNKIPVICPIYAYGTGHYVVIIGYSNDLVFFEDPMLQVSRGILTWEDFNKRWEDYDSKGNKVKHLGIAIWKNKVKNEEIVRKLHYL